MGSQHIDNWAQLVAVIVPFVAAAIMRTHWSTQVKAIVALGVAIVLGVVSVGVAGGFAHGVNWQTWFVQVGAIAGASQAIFALFRPAFKKVETATQVGAYASGGEIPPKRRKGTPVDDAEPVEGHGQRRPDDWRDGMPDE